MSVVRPSGECLAAEDRVPPYRRTRGPDGVVSGIRRSVPFQNPCCGRLVLMEWRSVERRRTSPRQLCKWCTRARERCSRAANQSKKP